MTSRTKRVLAGTAMTCVALLAPGIAQADWATGTSIGSVAKMAASRGDVTVDASGNAMAVWTETFSGNYRVVTSYRPVGGSWGTEQVLSSGSAVQFSDERPRLRLRFLPSGRAILLVVVAGNLKSYERAPGAASVWGDEQTVDSSGACDFPDMAINAQGNAVAVWTSAGTLYASRRGAATTWDARTTVASLSNGANIAAVGIDSAGTATIAYRDNTDVVARTLTGSLVSSPITVASGESPSNPTVGVAPNGAAVIGWRGFQAGGPGGNGVYTPRAAYRAASEQSFTTSTLPTTGALFSYGVRVGIDSAGNATAVWGIGDRSLSDVDRVETVSRPAAGSWDATATVLDSRGSQATNGNDRLDPYPQVSVAPNGDAVAAWFYDDDTAVGGVGNSAVVRRRSSGAWGARTTLATVAGANAQNTNPIAAVGSDGTAAALWQQGTSGSALSPYASADEPARAPAVTLNETTHDFGNQTVNTTGSATTLRLTNSGNADLTVSQATVTGPFTTDDTGTSTLDCVKTLAPGAFCEIKLRFRPTAEGAATGALTFTDNATGSPHAVSLSGTGQAAAPVDAAAPQISLVRPTSGQHFTQGEAVTASYACTDDKPGVTCVGTVPNGSPLDTSTTGVKSFTVTAKDSASRTTTTTVGYFVDARPVQSAPIQTTPTTQPSQPAKSTTPTTSTPVVVAGKQLPAEVKQQAKPVFDAVKSVPNTSTGSQLAKGISTPLLLPPNSSAGSGLIARDGGGLIARDGAGLIARDGGGLIARDGGGLIARDGAGLIARDGAGVISNLGGTALTGSVRGTGSALASTSASASAKRKVKAKLLVLATTRKTTKAGGRVTLKLKLSARGRKLVKRAFAPTGRQKVKLVMAVGMARPGTGLPAVIVVKPMTIKE